ncbi:ferredoxin [Thermocatellispora tengchongensis]|uniref:Ferredoxin n=1 Tax=Thermocatellispora tengchongensis TaxID=1073253 RepID=A0A840PPU3_9ACTN|nr:ferredoxin [Thermocatellispora tengchongensis]MBB5139791.1 ferredoxin [Thermocatellispora tengchongensis]
MTAEKWSLEVDRRRCVGNGMCVAVAPEHFTLTDGRSSPISAQVAPAEEVTEAFELCPMSAITIRDAAGAEIDPTR